MKGIKNENIKKELIETLENNKKIYQVKYYCSDIQDENRYVMAWDYIDEIVTEINDLETNLKLKRIVVEIYCLDTTSTDKNRNDML